MLCEVHERQRQLFRLIRQFRGLSLFRNFSKPNFVVVGAHVAEAVLRRLFSETMAKATWSKLLVPIGSFLVFFPRPLCDK